MLDDGTAEGAEQINALTAPWPEEDKAKIAVFLSGRGSNMAALLYAAKMPDCPYRINLVVSNDPKAKGLELAAAEGIATFAHPHKGMTRAAHDELMERAVLDAGADYIVLAGYMRILSAEFVGRWRGKMLNIHPSLLPKYKGLHTHDRAIEAGDAYGGCSVHLVTADLDDGPVLGQAKVKILPGDTADDLAARTLFAEHQLYPKIVSDYVARWRNPIWVLGELRKAALALDETEERESFGSPAWKIAGKTGKYFAYFAHSFHGEDGLSMLVKTSGADEQEALISGEPDIYYLPKFYGSSGWIGVRLGPARSGLGAHRPLAEEKLAGGRAQAAQKIARYCGGILRHQYL